MEEMATGLEEDLSQARDALRFNALRNAIYHTSRRLFFDRLARSTSFFVILFGTATFSALAQSSQTASLLLGGGLAIIGALQVVYDYAGQSRAHQILQRDYYRLLSDIEKTPLPAKADLARWTGELASLAGDEPPTMRALDAVAYNAAADALYHDHRATIRIGLLQSALKQVIAFNGTKFDYRSAD